MADLSYTTNLVRWYKPESLSALSNNDPVGSWTDSSATNLTISQSTSALKPIYKTNILNGYAGVLFDRTALQLLKSSQGTAVSTKPVSMFIVYKLASTAAQMNVFGDINPSGGDYSTGPVFFANASKLWAYANGTYFESTSNYNDTDAHYICIIYDGASSKLYKDGSADGTGSTGSTDFDGAIMGTRPDGTGSAYDGYIFEALLYDESISDANRGTVESYLVEKYFTAGTTTSTTISTTSSSSSSSISTTSSSSSISTTSSSVSTTSSSSSVSTTSSSSSISTTSSSSSISTTSSSSSVSTTSSSSSVSTTSSSSSVSTTSSSSLSTTSSSSSSSSLTTTSSSISTTSSSISTTSSSVSTTSSSSFSVSTISTTSSSFSTTATMSTSTSVTIPLEFFIEPESFDIY